MVGESLRLIRMIGRGAMGSVWAAEQLGLKSEVAVKFMLASMLDDAVSVQRFQQEARAAAEIRSPHVVRVFDNGVASDGTPYIVMELLVGESLERRVKRTGTLSFGEVAVVVTQAAKALAKAHERGIVHRDIKPANLYLTDDDGTFVKVVDFGVARFAGEAASELTAAGNLVGTPAYMSPEQLFHGKTADHRADLWSLAVCAYFALTGQRPFEGATLGELCVAVKRAQPTPPSQLRPDLSPEVDAWFARAFAPEIGSRFASAKELAQAFEFVIGVATTMSSTPSQAAAQLLLASLPGTAVPPISRAPAPPGKRLGIALGVAAVAGFGVVAAWLTGTLGDGTRARTGSIPSLSPASASVPGRDGATEPIPADDAAVAASASASTSATNAQASAITVDAPPDAAPTASASAAAPDAPPPVRGPAPPARGGGDVRARRAGEALGI